MVFVFEHMAVVHVWESVGRLVIEAYDNFSRLHCFRALPRLRLSSPGRLWPVERRFALRFEMKRHAGEMDAAFADPLSAISRLRLF